MFSASPIKCSFVRTQLRRRGGAAPLPDFGVRETHHGTAPGRKWPGVP
jgi:hypothetical protein